MEMMPRRWIAIYFATLCVVRAHHHGGHPILPIPFPYSAGSYKHTSSVVNVPIHQERLIIIKKPGNHHHHHGHAHGHKHGHAHSHGHDHDHHHSLAVNHGYNEQESRILSDFSEMRPVMNNYHTAHSHQYPYFEDLGYLLDPMFLQQSVWLDQFPDVI